jgi:ABC-2 type transport system ATP-binding protein
MIGYLPEHNPLYLDMYVKEFLRFAAGLHGLSAIEQKVKKVIEMTGLEIEQNKKIGSLSKGYRQRVGLAQALIHDPKVLILDEPTSGLDPVQIQEIRRLIKQLGEEKTVILSTHIMQEVEALCDHVVIINRGKIVADNDVSELKKIQKGREVVMIELDKKVKKQELEALSSVASVEVMPGQKWRITVKKDADFRKELFEWTMKNGLTVISLQSVSGSMEELFKQLTIRNN